MTETTTTAPDVADHDGDDAGTTRRAVEQLVETYFDMWRATDAAARAKLVAQAFTSGGRHVDPHADVVGHDQLIAMLAGVHDAYPGFSIERTSGIDQHGDQVRYTWRLDTADGATLVSGLDVAELDEGRFSRVTAFWGDLPPR